MNKIKLEYEQPSCNLLVVRFEQGILTGSDGWSKANSTPSIIPEDPDDESKNFGF